MVDGVRSQYLVILCPLLDIIAVLTEFTEQQLLLTQTPIDLTQNTSATLVFTIFIRNKRLHNSVWAPLKSMLETVGYFSP